MRCDVCMRVWLRYIERGMGINNRSAHICALYLIRFFSRFFLLPPRSPVSGLNICCYITCVHTYDILTMCTWEVINERVRKKNAKCELENHITFKMGSAGDRWSAASEEKWQKNVELKINGVKENLFWFKKFGSRGGKWWIKREWESKRQIDFEMSKACDAHVRVHAEASIPVAVYC